MHAALTLTDANFEQEVASFPGIVLVDFWAAWCGPCLAMAPHVDALAKKYADNPKVKVGKMDVDSNEQTSMAYRVMSLPTFKVFVGGQEVAENGGIISPDMLESMITQVMAQAA